MPYTIEEFSDGFFELWKSQKTVKDITGREIQLGGTISFAYIDGNHEYEYAKKDFKNVDELLENGGFILFDDSANSDAFGVHALVKEILKERRYAVIFKNPNYLLKKIK
jgi:hypothetical protein